MKKRRGAHPPTFMKHSGKILRTIVKQLKSIGYIDNSVMINDDGSKRQLGLVITKTGMTELDKISNKVLKPK
jgi:ribosomal protein S19E (S16A)